MLLLIHLLFARGFISAHPGGRTTSLSKMDWGKTLSSEQPRAADLAFLLLISRPGSRAETAESRSAAQARPPGRSAGLGTRRRKGQAGAAPGVGSRDCGEAQEICTVSGSGLGGHYMQTPMGSAPAFSPRLDPNREPLTTRRNAQSTISRSTCLEVAGTSLGLSFGKLLGLVCTLFAWTP